MDKTETERGNEAEPENRPEAEPGPGWTGGPEISIPPGSTEVRQSMWAWMWGLVPWAVVAILFSQQSTEMIILAVGLGIAVTIPRYLGWRKTAYHVTHNAVIFQRGLLGNSQLYNLPAEQFQRIVERPGLFGRYLGYHAVDIRMREGGKVSLSYVPISAGLTERVIRMRDRYSDYDEERELREMAMIEARQRGEVPQHLEEEFDRDTGLSDEQPIEASEEPEVADFDRPRREHMDEPKDTRKKPSATEATEYRPEVREYRADRDERDR